jgi:aromatic ring-cleaving dioxygenase
MAAEDGLAITFATNSSYFPPGTSKQLRSLVRGMAAGERYRVVLQAGVSGSDKVAGASNPEEARRYNRWLAERRVERVQIWLNENAAGADLLIEPQYLPGNEERTVVVRVAPAA